MCYGDRYDPYEALERAREEKRAKIRTARARAARRARVIKQIKAEALRAASNRPNDGDAFVHRLKESARPKTYA